MDKQPNRPLLYAGLIVLALAGLAAASRIRRRLRRAISAAPKSG